MAIQLAAVRVSLTYQEVIADTFAYQHAQVNDLIAGGGTVVADMDLAERRPYAYLLREAARLSEAALIAYGEGDYPLAFRSLEWARAALRFVEGGHVHH